MVMNVIQINVIEKRLFPPDVIPFRQLITATNLQTFAKPFLFRDTDLNEDANHNLVAVTMRMGEFKWDNKIHPIEQLVIDRLSITLNIHATSEIANKCYQQIASLLKEMDSEKIFNEDRSVIKTFQTSCVMNLDFDFTKLLSHTFSSFLEKDATKFCASAINNRAKVEIAPKSLVFNVNYSTVHDDENLRILTKPLTIEPRAGTHHKEKIYYTASPTDFETHLHLIELLDNQLKKNR